MNFFFSISIYQLFKLNDHNILLISPLDKNQNENVKLHENRLNAKVFLNNFSILEIPYIKKKY